MPLVIKAGTWGRSQLLDPSHPEALNFNEEQSFKSLGTAGTNSSLYTSAQSVSLGGTAFEPRDDEDVDSQESSIFGGSESSMEDILEEDTEGVFIANMSAVGLGSTNTSSPLDVNVTSSEAQPDGDGHNEPDGGGDDDGSDNEPLSAATGGVRTLPAGGGPSKFSSPSKLLLSIPVSPSKLVEKGTSSRGVRSPGVRRSAERCVPSSDASSSAGRRRAN